MNSFYIMLIVISSIVLPIRVKALNLAIKSGNKERIKMEWLFLGLTITLILVLIFIKNFS
jgi:hypothetical protein